MTRLYCDGPTLMRAVASAVANLEAHVEEIDALNVFPVPDGDTGSNMLATMRAALAEAEQLAEADRDLHAVAEALSRGALRGARGNSGVILSQIIRGMTSGADGRRRATGLDLAEGLRRGSEVAYGSVLTPVEGTILTVIRDAAAAAESAAGRQPHVEAVLAATIEAAARSVQRTPTLLPILEDSGVVDSGGQGLYRLLEGTMQLEGSVRISPSLLGETRANGHKRKRHGADLDASRRPDAPSVHGYETEYLVTSADGRLVLPAIREALQAVGESVVVAGDERRARIHAHGDRPDLALGIGLAWGRLEEVSIRDLDGQVGTPRPPARADGTPTAPAIGLVAMSRGDGFRRTLESLGARVVRAAHGERASVGEIARGILACDTSDVIVLPNDPDAILATAQARELAPRVSVHVVPTRNAAEGVVAALAFDAGAPLADNLTAMQAEASALRSFRVVTSARDSIIDGVPVRSGQVIALDADGRLLACEGDVTTATLRALDGLGAFELVTCYQGLGVEDGWTQALRDRIEGLGLGAEVEIVEGGQAHDLLVVAVE